MAVTISATQSEISYSVANNNSQVRVVVTATTTGESYNTSGNGITSTITVDGTKYSVTHKLPKKSTTTIFDKTLTIAHGSDGKKSVTTSYSVPTGISAGTLTGNATPNPLILTNTPRASVLNSVTISIANNGTTTIKSMIAKYVSSYYDILTLTNGSHTITLNGVTNNTSVTLSSAQLTELWKAFGNLTSITFSCKLQTKTSSSGTSIGTSATKSATATLPSYGLTITSSIDDSATAYNTYKPSLNFLILNLSKPKITWAIASSTGSTYGNTITSKINGTVRTSPYIISDFANINYMINASDGRMNATKNPFSGYTVVAYQKPSVVNCSLVRTSPTSSEATVTITIKYYDGTLLRNLKDLAFTFTYTQSGSSAINKPISDFTKGTSSTSNNMITVTYTLKITGLDYKKSITYGVTGTDILGVAFSKINLVLPQGLPLWNAFMYNSEQWMRVNGHLIADMGIRVSDTKGISNYGDKIFLRNNGGATILSAVNDSIYFRPILTSDDSVQAYFHKNGYFYAPIYIATTRLRIPNNGNDGYGLTNQNNVSIIRDYNNNNVTVDATGGVLYLGHSHTTGLNFLNKATMDENGNMIAPNITAITKNNVLWSGTYYMVAAHTITLSQKVSEQTNGIVLCWSGYQNGAAASNNWSFTFVPKSWVTGQNGQGVSCLCSGIHFSPIGLKYVYVKDNQIVGNDSNGQTGTSNGISYANNSFVLRYVIGI